MAKKTQKDRVAGERDKVVIDENRSVFSRVNKQKKYQHFRKLLEAVEEGGFSVYTSNIVVLEVVFVLSRIYRFPQQKVHHAIEAILDLRNNTLIEKTNTNLALNLFNKSKVKYSDCLIASQVPLQTTLLTYDKDFAKFPLLKTATPKDLLRL